MASTGGKNIYLMYNNIVYKINWSITMTQNPNSAFNFTEKISGLAKGTAKILGGAALGAGIFAGLSIGDAPHLAAFGAQLGAFFGGGITGIYQLTKSFEKSTIKNEADVENLNNELEGKTKPEEKLKENNKDQGQEKINPSSFSKTKHIDGLFPQGHNTNQSLASKSGNKPAPITNSKIKQPYNQ